MRLGAASARAVNSLMTATYWELGRRIVVSEQRGAKRADYGAERACQRKDEWRHATSSPVRELGWIKPNSGNLLSSFFVSFGNTPFPAFGLLILRRSVQRFGHRELADLEFGGPKVHQNAMLHPR